MVTMNADLKQFPKPGVGHFNYQRSISIFIYLEQINKTKMCVDESFILLFEQ